MAKSTSRGAKSAPKAAAKSAAAPQVQVVEQQSSGLGFEGGTAIVTALILIAAILLVDHELGALGTGAGIFFKG